MGMVLPFNLGHGGACQTNASASSAGTTLTANGTANVKGSTWTSLIDPTNGPSYGIWVRIRDVAAATTVTGFLMDIAIEPTGGGTAQIILPDLNGGGAPDHTTHVGGKDFFFPIYIPSGCRISARAQASTASDTALVTVYLCQKPPYPYALSRVSAYGVDGANSRGTLVTPGNNSLGTWTLLKAGPMDRPHVFWTVSLDQGSDNSQFDDRYYLVQLGVGPDSSNVSVIYEGHIGEEGGECLDSPIPLFSWGPTVADAAADLWCRMAETGAAEARGVIAYGAD